MHRDNIRYRSQLRIVEPERTGLITYDAKDADAKDGGLKYCYNVAGVHHFFRRGSGNSCRPASTKSASNLPTQAAGSARAGR